MRGINKVTLFGHLGADPEFVVTNGGGLLKLRVATTEGYKDSAGKWQDHTEWHNVQVWGKPAERWAPLLRKGDIVLIEGSIRTSNYMVEGQKRTKTEIKAWSVEGLAPIPVATGSDTEPAPQGERQEAGAAEDNIPF